jgi:hypothetical protein
MYHTIGAGRLRVTTKPVTLIQANRIKDFKASIEGDNATGTFAFHVPKLYEGKAKFTATKGKDGWEMQSFEMPSVNIHVARDKEGHWQDVAKQEDNAQTETATP